MDKKPLKMLVIAGTVRQGRVGRKIAEWYIEEARQANRSIVFELLDVADLKLPLFNESVPPFMGRYSELQRQVAEKIAAADGFVFITGEYNRSVPGSLKNFLDYIYHEWVRKPAAFVGYGVHGGVRAVEHLAQIMVSLEMTSVKHAITIVAPHMVVGPDGQVNPNFVHGDVKTQVNDLVWWARALKNARSEEEGAV